MRKHLAIESTILGLAFLLSVPRLYSVLSPPSMFSFRGGGAPKTGFRE